MPNAWIASACLLVLLTHCCTGVQAQDKAAPATLPAAAPPPVPAVKAVAAVEERRMYCIRCRVSETDIAGKTQLIAHPQLMTIEGQPATLQMGANVTPPDAIAPVDDVFSGKCLKVLLRRGQKGLLVLDANLELRQDQQAPGDRLVVTTTGVRVVEPVKLGQAFAVLLPNDEGKPVLRCEFTVSEVKNDLDQAGRARAPRR